MSNTSGVEEVFSIESGSGLIDLNVLSVKSLADGTSVETKLVKTLNDTSLLVFSERETIHATDPSVRRIALIKLGPDFYYPLEKDKNLVYKFSSNLFVLPANDQSAVADQYLVVNVKTDSNSYIIKQLDEILNYFATVVIEVNGASRELDAIKNYLGIVEHGLYPQLPSQEPNLNVQVNQGHVDGRAESIAKGIVVGAEYIAAGLNIGTRFTENLVHKGGNHIVTRETRTDTKVVDPNVIRTLKGVRYGAETTASVSTTVINSIANQTRRLSEHLAPHLHKHGSKLVSSATGQDESSSKATMTNIITVGASGFQGFGTIYQSVTDNAKTLAKAVANETVNYVNKRYGNDAGEATHEALYAAGSGYEAATAIKNLAPKAMAKKVGKEAGIAVVTSGAAKTGAAAATNGHSSDEGQRGAGL